MGSKDTLLRRIPSRRRPMHKRYPLSESSERTSSILRSHACMKFDRVAGPHHPLAIRRVNYRVPIAASNLDLNATTPKIGTVVVSQMKFGSCFATGLPKPHRSIVTPLGNYQIAKAHQQNRLVG